MAISAASGNAADSGEAGVANKRAGGVSYSFYVDAYDRIISLCQLSIPRLSILQTFSIKANMAAYRQCCLHRQQKNKSYERKSSVTSEIKHCLRTLSLFLRVPRCAAGGARHSLRLVAYNAYQHRVASSRRVNLYPHRSAPLSRIDIISRARGEFVVGVKA